MNAEAEFEETQIRMIDGWITAYRHQMIPFDRVRVDALMQERRARVRALGSEPRLGASRTEVDVNVYLEAIETVLGTLSAFEIACATSRYWEGWAAIDIAQELQQLRP